MKKILRPHQNRALDMLRTSLRSGHRRPMVYAPTGFGKTLLASSVADGARQKGNHAIFCVPAVSLIDQTVKAFHDEGIMDVGVIQADHPMTNPDMPIQVASVQTLMRRKIPSAQIVMNDEAHRWFEFYGDWMGSFDENRVWHAVKGFEEWQGVPFIGLSATPGTKGLGKYYDDLLIPTTTQELIDTGYLSPFRVFAPSHPDLTGVKTVAGDYDLEQISEIMQDAKLVADVVENWCRYGEGKPTLCFAVDRAHAKSLQAQFQRAGVTTDYVDAYTGRDERTEIAARFASGETKVVCNVGVLTTGVDWDVRCIILARPTKSRMLYVQIIGRGIRPVYAPWFDQACLDDAIRVRAILEGPKPYCTIFDHSDSTLRLGFVTDIHFRTLDLGIKATSETKSKDVEEAKPSECKKCGFLKPAKVRECPACGFKAEPSSEISVADGKLEEITPTQKKRLATHDEKLRIYGQMMRYAHLHNHKEGWIYHKFKDYFGVFPHPDVKREAKAIPVTPELTSWIKSRNIAWAKSKKRKDSLRAA